MAEYTLGLDIGAKSVGWAVVENGTRARIVAMGVRVFPEGVDREKSGLEKSKGASRREARGARRTRRRRTLRRTALIAALRGAGLAPADDGELAGLLSEVDPYPLRAKGLDEPLTPHEFGRVLYHINQRRGFKSNSKSAKQKEDGEIAKQAGLLQAAIEAAGCRTVGEYFARTNPEENRIRGHYTFRSMYEREFDLLWAKQAVYHPDVLTDHLCQQIRDRVIFFQRPLKPTDALIGECGLEPGEKRCAKAAWCARRFRMLQDVNNLRIHNPDGREVCLSDGEREIVLREMQQKAKVTFSSIRKKLNLLETQEFNAEYEVDEKGGRREALAGDAFSATMRSKKVFGNKAWDAMDEARKVRLNEAFVELEDDELVEVLAGEYGLSAEQMEAAMKVPLERGYMSFSRKAIEKLLPLMEAGKRTDEALDAVYPGRNQRAEGVGVERLPMPEDLRNPIVNRALVEVRKVVNAIAREYGKPKRIRVEMARDVKGSAKERREKHYKMLDNERRNAEVREKLRQDIGIARPTRDDVIKYKLWEECGHTCPYTGKHISQTALFGPNPDFQVEHILPYSRSLDDSYMNKTLCEVRENRVKANRTPWEAYGGDEQRFEQILQRVKTLPWPKRQKFQANELEGLDACIQRELNDTRYISREVVRYLKMLGVIVTGTRGSVTAELRHQWGLNTILDPTGSGEKNRADHRHHAIDAVVTAVTSNEHLRRLAESKYGNRGDGFAPPWEEFREEVEENVRQINVSHRVRRKVSGELHEKTFYGPTSETGIYVYRKDLTALTPAMVAKIVDPVVREIVEERLRACKIDGQRDKKIPKEVWNEPLYMRTTKSDKKVLIKKVRIRDVFGKTISFRDGSGSVYKTAKPGSNHHVEIFEYTNETDKSGRPRRDAVVVSLFDAVQRSKRGEPVVCRDHGPGTRFVCSLAINEMVLMDNGSGEMDLYRVQKMDVSKTVYFRQHTAATLEDEGTLIRKAAHVFEGYKVVVDPLGRVYRAND